MIKEFCAENFEHIPQAINAGASRIELCDNLVEGGTTPSYGVIKQEVRIYRYVARNSFDSYLWQTQENKLKFINQIMTENSVTRSADDIDQSTLDVAEAKALATNNPLLLEKLNVDKEVMNLQLLKSSWQSTRIALNQKVETTFPERLEVLSNTIPKLQTDVTTTQEQLKKDFEIQLMESTIQIKKKL